MGFHPFSKQICFFGLFVCLYFKTVSIFDSMVLLFKKIPLFSCVYNTQTWALPLWNCVNLQLYFFEIRGIESCWWHCARKSVRILQRARKNATHKTQFIKFEHLVVCECDFSSCIIIRQCLRFVCWFFFCRSPTTVGRCVQPKCWLQHEPELKHIFTFSFVNAHSACTGRMHTM